MGNNLFRPWIEAHQRHIQYEQTSKCFIFSHNVTTAQFHFLHQVSHWPEGTRGKTELMTYWIYCSYVSGESSDMSKTLNCVCVSVLDWNEHWRKPMWTREVCGLTFLDDTRVAHPRIKCCHQLHGPMALSELKHLNNIFRKIILQFFHYQKQT